MNRPFWIVKMRIIVHVLLMVMLLVGCNSITGPLRSAVRPNQETSTPIALHFPIEKSQTPIFDIPKSVGTIPIITNKPDSTLYLAVEPAETETIVSSNTSSLFDGSVTDSSLVLKGQQARGSKILNRVSLISQHDFTSCGEAAFAMGWNYIHPERPLDVGMVEAVALKLNIYFPARSATPSGYLGTPPSGMEGIGNYYAKINHLPLPTVGNIDLDNGGAYARLEAKGLLYDQLSMGNPVIIEVSDRIGSPSKIYNDSHYVIVTGMNFDNDIVIFNDPLVNFSMSGKYSGLNRSAEWSQIWDSWSNNKDINPGEGGHPGQGWYMVVH